MDTKIKESLLRYVELNSLHATSSEEIAVLFNRKYNTSLTEAEVWRMLGRNR